MNSHITPDELASLKLENKLHQRSAWLYQRVSQTQFKLAAIDQQMGLYE